MRRLTENISSRYVEAANRLRPKTARRRIVAYVESYDDIFFWRTVLGQFETPQRYFEIMLPTRADRLERGKKAAIMSMVAGGVGRDMLALVDADYDYLLQGASPTSRAILASPYVFHTYAYAIENLQCYAPSLHDICVAATLNDQPVFDCEEYLRAYSEAVFPLFVWNILYYRAGRLGEFSITDFLRAIDTGHFSLDRAADTLERLRHKVGQKLKQLQRANPGSKARYADTRESLRQLGVEPDNTYLFIQGHHLADNVVVPMLKAIATWLVRRREQEIQRQSLHAAQYRNEMSCYTKSVADIAFMLKRNVGYVASEPYRRIVQDLRHFLDTETPPETKP